MVTTSILLLVVLTGLFIPIRKVGWKKWYYSLKELDEESPLYTHSIFHLAIAVPLIIALGFALMISPGLNAEFSVEGYKQFLDFFNFPLWIAGGSILFGVVVGRFHASKQRARAISQTEVNNNFKNYYEHKKLFINSFKHSGYRISHSYIGPMVDVKLFKETTYGRLFPHNSMTNFNPSCYTLKDKSHFQEIMELVSKKASEVTSRNRSKDLRYLFALNCSPLKTSYGVEVQLLYETNSDIEKVLDELSEDIFEFSVSIAATIALLILNDCKLLTGFNVEQHLDLRLKDKLYEFERTEF
ncbi:hypothetical protein EYS14_01595 [Alteromonadaceae bacterium M269]|nr:hypothetical protein EYS14_01595 [Alteromonadaceae bacterium M269]